MISSIHVFKALADETRFKLLTLLLSHDLCVGALARHLGTSEAAVSQHLKQLREAGLVKGVGDTESGPKSDTLGEASTGIRTDHYLDFRHEGKGKESGVRQF
jgi:DNA-binding transcriptional ArsR family regulator